MFGVHIDSHPEKIYNEVSKYNKLGCNVVQLFVSHDKKWSKYYEKFSKYCEKKSVSIVVHISYTINCAKNWNKHSWWIQQFINEIKIANDIGAFCVVVHLGKLLDLTIEEATNNMFSSLIYVNDKTNICKSKILLETSTGQGTEMFYNIDDLKYFFNKFSNHRSKQIRERFGLCFDTCHVFASGYDIREEDVFDKIVNILGTDGIINIKLIHLNDSKKDVGSKLDRHENINHGFIKKKPLIRITKYFKKLGIPIILETPVKYIEDDIELVKII